MRIIPIVTPLLKPPKDDLFLALKQLYLDLKERDIVLISSKVVSIHQGRCVPMTGKGIEKKDLVLSEADMWRERKGGGNPLTIKYGAFISNAGIDESNGCGHYVLLPKEPYQMARKIQEYFCNRFHLTELGVVITDSHSQPFRYGALSVAIAGYGFSPVRIHTGEVDLFGRVTKYGVVNVIDSLASMSTLVCGEGAQRKSVVIARGVPDIDFGDFDVAKELLVPPDQDRYFSIYDDFKKGGSDI